MPIVNHPATHKRVYKMEAILIPRLTYRRKESKEMMRDRGYNSSISIEENPVYWVFPQCYPRDWSDKVQYGVTRIDIPNIDYETGIMDRILVWSEPIPRKRKTIEKMSN